MSQSFCPGLSEKMSKLKISNLKAKVEINDLMLLNLAKLLYDFVDSS